MRAFPLAFAALTRITPRMTAATLQAGPRHDEPRHDEPELPALTPAQVLLLDAYSRARADIPRTAHDLARPFHEILRELSAPALQAYIAAADRHLALSISRAAIHEGPDLVEKRRAATALIRASPSARAPARESREHPRPPQTRATFAQAREGARTDTQPPPAPRAHEAQLRQEAPAPTALHPVSLPQTASPPPAPPPRAATAPRFPSTRAEIRGRQAPREGAPLDADSVTDDLDDTGELEDLLDDLDDDAELDNDPLADTIAARLKAGEDPERIIDDLIGPPPAEFDESDATPIADRSFSPDSS